MAISLSCGSPAQASVGFYYEHQLVASGGSAFPYVYTIIAGSLPPGMNLDPATGIIYGTPQDVPGTYAFVAQVNDSGDSSTASCGASITVIEVVQPLTIGCNSPPTGLVGNPYAHSFIINGGEPPYSVFTTNGTLPPGLFVDNQGTVSGTPNTAGTYGFQIRVFDSGNPARNNSAQCFITVNQPAQQLTINCNNPPAGTVGVFYNHTPLISGGTPGYTITVSVGTLPAGLLINSSVGTIGGIPTTPGTSTFTLHVQDSLGAVNNVVCSITINPSPLTLSLDCNNPPPGTLNVPYLHGMNATGGQPAYTYTVISGQLPPGLTLFSSNGTISGTPTQVGAFGFNVQVRDANNNTASVGCTIQINSAFLPLAVNCNNPPVGNVGFAYSHAFIATGGHQPYTWTISSGALPGGIVMSTPGSLTGVATAAGTFNFTVRVTDVENNVAQVACSITILAATTLNLSCNNPVDGTVGTPYTHQFTAQGGTPGYTFSIFGGTLQAGLTMSSGGLITGTPTEFGYQSLTIKVVDSLAAEAYVQCTIHINSSSNLALNCNNPPKAVVGQPYSHNFLASGGTPPYTFTSLGITPAGITLNSDGSLTGTPVFSDTGFTLSIRVTDSAAAHKDITCILVIDPFTAVQIFCDNPPDGEVGIAYGHQIQVANEVAPVIFEISAGSLPTGLFMHTDGFIQGTPSAVGNFSFTVKVTDHAGGTASVGCSVSIFAGATLQCNNPPKGKVGVPYAHQIIVPPDKTVVISAGALPPGLTIDSKGQITGTPSAKGVYTFTVSPTS